MAHSVKLQSTGSSAYLRTGRGSATSALWQALVSGIAIRVERFAEERRVRRPSRSSSSSTTAY